MFENIPVAPPDSILGLTEAFNKDPRTDKINLSVGVYKDAAGKTPVLKSVKEAEKRLVESEPTKNYLPIDGAPEFGAAVRDLLFGKEHEAVKAKRVAISHVPSGTAGLRVASDYLKKMHPNVTIWMSDPTWPNHPQVFTAAGLATKSYPYFNAKTNDLAFDAMIAGLKAIPSGGGDVVLLHGCCHNPSGIDPNPQQWQAIAQVVRERKLLPLVDFAYQGFGIGLQEDAECLRALVTPGAEAIIVSSYSKNFGLYRERVGALTVVAGSEQAAQTVQSQVKTCIRANYSSPPSHGGAVVTTILSDPALRQQWEAELKSMRDRINGMRRLFVETLKKKGVPGDFSFIARQKGMFSFSGLSKDQVERLKKEFAVYVVGNGRINVAGMTESNMDALCEAIAKVMAGQPQVA